MQIYFISALDAAGNRLDLDAVDNPAQAAARLQKAIEDYPRAWASDQDGQDVSVSDLSRLAENQAAGK